MKTALALILVAFSTTTYAASATNNPFQPEASPKPVVPDLPVQKSGQLPADVAEIINRTQPIGNINGVEVFYHDPTKCYLFRQDGNFRDSPCLGIVTHWLRNNPAGIGLGHSQNVQGKPARRH